MLIEGLYELVDFKYKDDIVDAVIRLNKDHQIFEGHFPGHPVLPGVCVIQIIKELAEKALQKNLILSVASNVKFMAVINPEKNDTIQLQLHITSTEEGVKVKNTVHIDDILALKLNATFKNRPV
ncbi:3-hydroxyacyl-ACP dehydratase [Maribacter sp. CXY002]|uniref:3-hydroxyacyl-ACP dehydratase n=1 Tax=Maribacter luteocoastalis TaxID=3407671 RepID=UPI003B677E71